MSRLVEDEKGSVKVWYVYIEGMDDFKAVTVTNSDGFWECKELIEHHDHDLEIYSWEIGDDIVINPSYIVLAKCTFARLVSDEEYERMMEGEE